VKSEALRNAQASRVSGHSLGFAGYKTARNGRLSTGGSAAPVFDYESANDPITREIQHEAPFKLDRWAVATISSEFQRRRAGRFWIMVHSGSRNVGLKIANFL